MKRLAALLIFTVSVMCLSQHAFARDEAALLDTMKEKLSNESEKKKQLQKRHDKVANELRDVKFKLRKSGHAIRENEDRLQDIESRIIKLENKKTSLDATLKSERVSIIKLVLILERIRKTPPQAMLAKPDSPYKVAQTALLMENIIPAVKRHAEKLKANLETLEKVSLDLDREQKSLTERTASLKSQKDSLQALLDKKERIFTATNNDLEAKEITIQGISLKAKNLEELVAKLKEEEQREIERLQAANILRRKPTILNMDDGEARLPVSGIVRVAYHDKDDVGAESKGLTIEGRSGGLVIAPMGGKIQFTGMFKRYGNIIIIEHADGYHSLIAGLEKITGSIGDHVKSGEPIGVLPDSSLIPRPKLYYELRQNGTPVNPSVKFSDLG